jgi:hypothetical protein
MSIFEEVKQLGVFYSNHESDLYIPKLPQTEELINRYEFKHLVTEFHTSNGQRWYEIPYAFDPFWVNKAGKVTAHG